MTWTETVREEFSEETEGTIIKKGKRVLEKHEEVQKLDEELQPLRGSREE